MKAKDKDTHEDKAIDLLEYVLAIKSGLRAPFFLNGGKEKYLQHQQETSILLQKKESPQAKPEAKAEATHAIPVEEQGQSPLQTQQDKIFEQKNPVEAGSFHLIQQSLEKEYTPSFLDLKNRVTQCQLCRLRDTCHQPVFGSGKQNALIMVIGEAPGQEEDMQALPFVGKSGKEMQKWFESIGFSREEIFITNIVKCRPPQNRDPHEDEVSTCKSYLEQQIDEMKPKAIVALGRFSGAFFTQAMMPMGEMRQKTWEYGKEQIPVFITYHPAATLYNRKLKYAVWADMKKLAQYLYQQGHYQESQKISKLRANKVID